MVVSFMTTAFIVTLYDDYLWQWRLTGSSYWNHCCVSRCPALICNCCWLLSHMTVTYYSDPGIFCCDCCCANGCCGVIYYCRWVTSRYMTIDHYSNCGWTYWDYCPVKGIAVSCMTTAGNYDTMWSLFIMLTRSAPVVLLLRESVLRYDLWLLLGSVTLYDHYSV